MSEPIAVGAAGLGVGAVLPASGFGGGVGAAAGAGRGGGAAAGAGADELVGSGLGAGAVVPPLGGGGGAFTFVSHRSVYRAAYAGSLQAGGAAAKAAFAAVNKVADSIIFLIIKALQII